MQIDHEQEIIITNYTLVPANSHKNDFPESLELTFSALNTTFSKRFYKSTVDKKNSEIYKIEDNNELEKYELYNQEVTKKEDFY